jgi:hypothetical protein
LALDLGLTLEGSVRGEEIVLMFVLVGIPWVLGWIYRTHLSHKRFMKVLQLKAEMNSRLLDRVGTDPAVVEFLKSDAQQHMFDVRPADLGPRMPPPYMRMLTAVQISFMLLSAGSGLLYIREYMLGDGREAFLFLGTLGVALGVGALLSAVAAFAVARLWNNLNNGRELTRS